MNKHKGKRRVQRDPTTKTLGRRKTRRKGLPRMPRKTFEKAGAEGGSKRHQDEWGE